MDVEDTGQDGGVVADAEGRAVTPPSQRMESGPVRFGDDWPGVFFRGDEAVPFGATLRSFLNSTNGRRVERMVLEGLAADLLACEQGGPKPVALRYFDECLADAPERLVSIAEMEERHVFRVLVATGGNKSKTARILKMDRRTLYRKLAAYVTAEKVR